MSFPNRTKSQTFVDSIVSIYNDLGGFDGLDWNTFEGVQVPATGEMIWISQTLKQRFPGFIITAPPAPSSRDDKDLCSAMVQAGALDYAAPQYYDGPNLADQAYIVNSVDEWSSLLGEDHVMVGFSVWTQSNYMSASAAASTWSQVKSKHANLRGGFDWGLHLDRDQGWPFAKTVAPLIRQ
jgi:chitinase